MRLAKLTAALFMAGTEPLEVSHWAGGGAEDVGAASAEKESLELEELLELLEEEELEVVGGVQVEVGVSGVGVGVGSGC